MSQRTAIMSALISHIAAATNSTGFRGLRFLHEVNSFPSFYIHPQNESRIHEGDGGAYSVVSYSVRGYEYSDDVGKFEQFMREIEVAVQTFRNTYSSLVDEARVMTVRTDEGAMAPYGIVDMQISVIYSVDYHYGMNAPIRADSTVVTADSTVYTADRG